jgi:hypothetical protein
MHLLIDAFAARSRADQKVIDARGRDGSAPPPHGHNAPQVMSPQSAAAQLVGLLGMPFY